MEVSDLCIVQVVPVGFIKGEAEVAAVTENEAEGVAVTENEADGVAVTEGDAKRVAAVKTLQVVVGV